MNPLLVIGALGIGGYLLTKAGDDPSKQVPADANALLGTVLAPSMTDPAQLGQFMNVFLAAAKNQTTSAGAHRLALYALVTALKRAMVAKGAQPNPLELLAIAYAPSSWADHQSDGLADSERAVSDALAADMTSAAALKTYIAALQQSAANSKLTKAQQKRIIAQALALQAKLITLVNGAAFEPATYMAIAKMTGGAFAKYLADSSQSGASILRYAV